MKVLLKRDLFLAGRRFRQNPLGTEIPGKLDGKNVVLFSAWDRADEGQVPLPRDAKLFSADAPVEESPLLRSNAHSDEPVALSQLPKQKGPKKVFAAAEAEEDDV